MKSPDQVRRIKDPIARIAAARAAAIEQRAEFEAKYEAAQLAYRQVTAEAVQELLNDHSLAEVGRMLGVSRQRVHQMARAD